MLNNYLRMWKKYADFRGRDTRAEYWHAFLINSAIGFVLSLLAYTTIVLTTISGLYSLAAIIPGLALFTRRMHDIGKSGKLWIVAVIPIAISGAFALAAFIGTIGALAFGGSGAAIMTFITISGIFGCVTIAVGIYMIILLAKQGDYGANKYGEDPRGGNGREGSPMPNFRETGSLLENRLDKSGQQYKVIDDINEENPAKRNVKRCPSCGAECGGLMAYCSECGTKMR
jgi:uncharacterized membrane protein YhaH (DUF805 family)